MRFTILSLIMVFVAQSQASEYNTNIMNNDEIDASRVSVDSVSIDSYQHKQQEIVNRAAINSAPETPAAPPTSTQAWSGFRVAPSSGSVGAGIASGSTKSSASSSVNSAAGIANATAARQAAQASAQQAATQ